MLICATVILAYSNTFHSTWHFDDRPVIVDNPHLHATRLDKNALIHAAYSNPQDHLQIRERPYRPVANISFALNWFFHQSDVLGFHIVNISIHILTALILLLTLLRLYGSPRLKDKSRFAFQIALLAALAWALHPIQTQAVTYIVQRMAQLAALFYIIGIYCYISARQSESTASTLFWSVGCVLAYVLAFGSKENASIFPLALLLVELVFFQELDTLKSKRIFIGGVILTGLITFGVITLYTGKMLPAFVELYSNRNFTMEERLLTQPRVLFKYLGQIFYPVPSRFSIAHDITISTSLFSPASTLACILGIFAACGSSLLTLKRAPIVSFAVLFYFLNHIVESSIIPLELFFEHRNYLPSLFLFWPLAGAVFHFQTLCNRHTSLPNQILPVTAIFILICLGSATFIRNQVWKSNDTLWIDALKKAPNHARPYNVLATDLAWGKKSIHPERYDMALDLFEKALDKYSPRKTAKSGTYVNMASIYYNQKKDYEKAIALYEQGLKVDPESFIAHYYIINPLMMSRQWDKALSHADFLLSRRHWDGRYHLARGRALFWKGNYKEALASFESGLEIEPGNPRLLLYVANSLNRLHLHSKALPVLEQALQGTDIDSFVHLARIETHTRMNNADKVKKNLEIIFSLYDMSMLKEWLGSIRESYLSVPVDLDIIEPVIFKEIEDRNDKET